MKQNIYSSILFTAILIMISSKTFAQGVGNHLTSRLEGGSANFSPTYNDTSNHVTMSLENCSHPAANVIQFDLMVVSNGDTGSVLRPNSIQFGINFDCCILQAGDSVVPSYVANSSDFVTFFSLNQPAFIYSSIPCHIRIEEPPGGNSGQTMILGTKYRFGTFRLTCTTSFTSFCPNFTLQDTPAPQRTTTAAIFYVGNNSSVTVFNSSVSEDTLRLLMVNCTTCNCTNGIDENYANPLISFFPNPATNALSVTFPKNISKSEIKIINLVGEVKYSATASERQTTIDVSSFSNGVYILETTVGNTVGRYEFVKM